MTRRRTRRHDPQPQLPRMVAPVAPYPEAPPEPPVYDDVWARNSDR